MVRIQNKSKKIQDLAARIWHYQKKVDELLNKLYRLDEDAGAEVSERLQDREGT